jgi:putative FmdB family regulatory protein
LRSGLASPDKLPVQTIRMPTYQYICTKCEHEFDLLQSIKDKPLTVCPKDSCGLKRWGKGRVKRKISAGGGLIFKGTGFYITDYRSENYKAGAKKEAPPAASGGGDAKPAGAKPDAKPDAKPAASKPSKDTKAS